MSRALTTFCIVSLHLLASSLTVLASVSVSFPVHDYGPKVGVRDIPSFVIAQKGVRHELQPYYTIGLPGFPAPPDRTVRCTLVSGPAGATLSETGIIEWIPAESEIGKAETFLASFTAIEGGQEVFTTTKTFSTTVLAQIPQLLELAPITSYERNPIGWSRMIFSGFQPRDAERKLFRWSLINPPPSVYIDDEGGLHWPDYRGYARPEPYAFTIRIDYPTASGTVSDEIPYTHYILPQPATNNFTDLRTEIQPQAKAMLGYSIDATDQWLATGEPFPDSAWNTSSNPHSGRVRLFRKNSAGTYQESLTLQPSLSTGGQAFGASVSLSPATATQPIRLAVGAPEARRIKPSGESQVHVGYIYTYTCDASGEWQSEARLEPPLTSQLLHFGGCVSLQGDTLIASMDGIHSHGPNTGALAVYHHDGSSWTFSQMLQSPDPASGDYFSYPAQLSGDWIAAAANEDDDHGGNTGSVHLFEKIGAQYIHRQEIHAPTPEPESLFGERLEINGSWLFVSSFREDESRGAVHIYQLTAGQWHFHQTLTSPYATTGSSFGASLSLSGDTLAVSAPGYLFGPTTNDPDHYPWSGITLFHLRAGTWEWQRQVTDNPDGSPGPNTWGYAIEQLSPSLTAASIPDFRGYANGEYLPLAGRLFLHRWPDLLADPFTTALASLPPMDGQPASANDDSNHNGIPNLIEWMMGHDPSGPFDSWTSRVPESTRPFLRIPPSSQQIQFMVPALIRGLRYTPAIETSENLIDWTTVTDARWEPLEMIYFKKQGSNHLTYFHPVTIPSDTATTPTRRYFRLRAPYP